MKNRIPEARKTRKEDGPMAWKAVQQSKASLPPKPEITFEDAYFIRSLTAADDETVTDFLLRCGFSREQAKVHFGVFDENHDLIDLFEKSDVAFAAIKESNCSLLWIQ